VPTPFTMSKWRRLCVTLAGAAGAGICAALVLALVANMPALSRPAEEDALIAKSLATMRVAP
jgi:uncharacterized protein involved in exopolysaccharide biosynthesis